MFGAGTACVICPVKDILYENEVLHMHRVILYPISASS